MADVDAGAIAPVVNAPAADAVPAPDAPTVQDNANQPPADGSVKPKTYTEDEHKELVAKQVNERLSKERRRLERIARAEAEAAFYKRQLEERDRPQQTQQPKGRPKQEDFAGRPYDDYVEALADWRFEQRMAAEHEKSAKETTHQRREREMAERAQHIEQTIVSKGREKYPDFDEVAFGDVPITEAMLAAASRLKSGADLIYHLGQNPAEASRIAHMSDIDQVYAMKDLESKLSAAPVTTKAPPPIVPNGARASTTKDWKDMSTKEHVEAWLNRKKR